MKARLKKVSDALVAPQARPAEIALARIILAALGVKLGVNLADWLK